jgi:hypothetical protein
MANCKTVLADYGIKSVGQLLHMDVSELHHRSWVVLLQSNISALVNSFGLLGNRQWISLSWVYVIIEQFAVKKNINSVTIANDVVGKPFVRIMGSL